MHDGSQRVLIVDDDASTVDVFARTLRLEGYEVLSASSAEAAFREIEKSRPDVILVDLRMPATDGISFLRRLRGLERGGPHMPVAVITGDHSVDENVSRELRELDATLYFKPVPFDELLLIIQRLLQPKP
jgi:DNA-binding NtrC family response regulator